MNEKEKNKLILGIISFIAMVLGIISAQLWLNIVWWKVLIIYILLGISFNIENKLKNEK